MSRPEAQCRGTFSVMCGLCVIGPASVHLCRLDDDDDDTSLALSQL